jgi:hypothetical protein
MTRELGEGANPYAAPGADRDPPAGHSAGGAFAQALFSPAQITVATVFGSLFGGALLLQANYRAMGRDLAAAVTLALGATLTAGILVSIGYGVPPLGVNLGAVVAFSIIARALQRDLYRAHVAAIGPVRSSWWVLAAIAFSIATRMALASAILRIAKAFAHR